MKYLSDIEENRIKVKASFYSESDTPNEPEFIESCYQAAKEVVALTEDNVTRKAVVKSVLNVKYELAVWKAVARYDNWIQFVTDLQLAKVPVRDLTLIKQIVDEEFKNLLDDASFEEDSDKLLVIEDVKSVVTEKGPRGLIVRIELL